VADAPLRVVVIGGVAGGMSAATRLRRLDPSASITVIERSGYVSYANCGLPYYMGGVISDESSLLLQTPESLHARFRLDVHVGTEAVAIDRDRKVVRVRDVANGDEREFPYDALILSPGAGPIVPPLPGIERAHTLRTVEDVQRITGAMAAHPPHRAVIVGGGFIGLEAAENLRHRGIDVALVEAAPQVLAPLDPELAAVVQRELERHGVDLHLGASLTGITAAGVELSDGTVLPSDLTLLAIGVRPDTRLAADAGLEVGPRGGIKSNDLHQTSDPSIYAIGDAAEKVDAVYGEDVLIPLANIANRHGRIVADHIAGREIRATGSLGTAIVKVFDLTVAVTGWNEKRLSAAGRPFVVLHSHPGSHAGYYPGAQTMHLKLLVSPDGEILGAQAVGLEGVDKRVDVIATAMRGGISAVELADLELAYAPPFGSAKDPVNMLGYMAENVLSGMTPTIQWHELDDALAGGAALVDVRSPEEFAAGHIDGALNIPVDQLRERMGELPDDRRVIVTCAVGQRGHTATVLLNGFGYDASNLDGGYATYSAARLQPAAGA
jgi:NADPH-dependent 2,4-dienoyl-CoA reductase/sulfur reductase-like enzyme/rhodanese-related sulfurtransferase